MTAEQYKKISAPFRTERRIKILKITNKVVTASGFAAYPILLFYLYLTCTDKLFAAIAVPASGFILLTVIRRKINRPRPYVTLDIQPLIPKEKKGNSMPSRHVFSMTIIAAAWFTVSPAVSAILMILSVVLAFIRIIGGIHYPSDVAAGAVCAILWAYAGFSLLL